MRERERRGRREGGFSSRLSLRWKFCREIGSKGERGRLFLPPLLAREFVSRERRKGRERNREKERDRRREGDIETKKMHERVRDFERERQREIAGEEKNGEEKGKTRLRRISSHSVARD